jgi:phosphoribosylcarboxyaminoimidazole (NCAIR) mutase
MASVGIIMGSQSDWETMRHAAETLAALDVAHEVNPCRFSPPHAGPPL